MASKCRDAKLEHEEDVDAAKMMAGEFESVQG